MANLRFRTGDIVKIRKTSEWNKKTRNNPENTEGEIDTILPNGRFSYWVTWSSGGRARYNDIDLGLVRRA